MRVGHIGMTVLDLDRAEAFYRDVFGFATFFRIRRDATVPWLAAQTGYPYTDIEFCHMRGHGLHLELLQYHHPRDPTPLPEDTYRPGSMHVNFCVDDIVDVTARLAAYIDATIRDASNRTRFAGDAHDLDATMITDGPQTGGKGYYLRDPDGHTLEIWQPAPAAQFGVSPGRDEESAVSPV